MRPGTIVLATLVLWMTVLPQAPAGPYPTILIVGAPSIAAVWVAPRIAAS